MLISRRRPIRPLGTALAFWFGFSLTGCGGSDSATGPSTGALTIHVVTTGNDIDADGYTVTTNGQTQNVGANGSVTFDAVPRGSQQVSIAGNAANCAIGGTNPRQVNVLGGLTTEATISIACRRIGGGTHIVFATNQYGGHYEIAIMNTDGSNVARLTNNTSDDLAPAWAPDGGRIAYECGGDICVMNPDGSGVTNITNTPALETDPAWLPGGTGIGFARNDGAAYHIYRVAPDGSGLTEIAPTLFGRYPAWSPSGGSIAFICRPTTSDYELCLMNADGNNTGLLTQGGGTPGPAAPAWSPDGTLIALATNSDGTSGKLLVLDAANPGVGEFVGDPALVAPAFPSWSPDGATLVFDVPLSGGRTIETINLDGTGLTPLTTAASGVQNIMPDWEP